LEKEPRPPSIVKLTIYLGLMGFCMSVLAPEATKWILPNLSYNLVTKILVIGVNFAFWGILVFFLLKMIPDRWFKE